MTDHRDTVAPSPQQPTQEATSPLNEVCDECGARMGEHIIGPGGYHPKPVTQKQPTQEALSEALDYLDFPEVPWDKIKDALLPETRNQIISLATLLDRFAAQHVTAAPVSGDALEAAHKLLGSLDMAGGWPTGNDYRRIAEALTAATDKTRREAIEECARKAEEFREPRILAMWDRPGGPPGNGWIPLTGKHVADAIRALSTPQNPGDAEASCNCPAKPGEDCPLTAAECKARRRQGGDAEAQEGEQ
jgi:hypothetical protein